LPTETPNSHSHGHANGYADVDPDGYADVDPDGYADVDPDGYADVDPDGYADVDPDGYPDSDADVHADADAVPVRAPGQGRVTEHRRRRPGLRVRRDPPESRRRRSVRGLSEDVHR